MSWNNKTKGLVKSYQRYAGMPDQVYREKLREYTGATSSTAPHLNGRAFEMLMPVLESAAHLAELNGTAHGRKPRKITDWYYWRRRYRSADMATHAQIYRIEHTFPELLARLDPPPADPRAYLIGICEHAAGRTGISGLADLRRTEARWVIEAMKDRLRYAVRREATA